MNRNIKIAGICVLIGAVIAGAIFFVSVVLTSNNEPETSSEYDFSLEYEEVTERAPEEGERMCTIRTDTGEYKIGESSLMSFEAFMDDAYLQKMITDFLFDVEPYYYPETFKYEDGVCTVAMNTYDGDVIPIVIDTNTEEIYWLGE